MTHDDFRPLGYSQGDTVCIQKIPATQNTCHSESSEESKVPVFKGHNKLAPPLTHYLRGAQPID